MYGTQAVARPRDRVGAAFADFQRLAQQVGVSAERADRYNEELGQYFDRYQHYVDDHAAWRETFSLHHLVKIVIANDGTAPASNIDLDLFFLMELSQSMWMISRMSRRPKPPRRPQGIMDFADLSGSGYIPSLMTPSWHDMLNRNYEGKPIVGGGGRG